MGNYKATYQNYTQMVWCHKNAIYITPVEVGFRKRRWYIEISIGGKVNKSPEEYAHTSIWNQIFKYRNYYYEKYKK